MSKDSESQHPAEPSEATTKPEGTVFTYDEISNTVKDFVLAYTEGRVKITFPDADSIRENAGKRGEKVSEQQAAIRAQDAKHAFFDTVKVVTGGTRATDEEYKSAVHTLFGIIVGAQMGGRLEGSFAGASAQDRLDDMERKLNATNHLVETLVRWLRDALGI